MQLLLQPCTRTHADTHRHTHTDTHTHIVTTYLTWKSHALMKEEVNKNTIYSVNHWQWKFLDKLFLNQAVAGARLISID